MNIAPFALTAAALFLAACGNGQAEDAAAQSTPDAEITSGSAELSEEETRIRRIVRDYLMERPEVILEAVQALENRERAAAQEQMRLAAIERLDEIAGDPRVPAIGPEDADVTIVEFFDYNCVYCKMAADWVQQSLDEYPERVRVVFRDYPVLNDRYEGTSVPAARAAMAAAEQGKFLEMHFALYEASASLTEENIDAIAEEVGVDVAQMRADMEENDYGAVLADTMALGQEIGINGTPFFLVGDQIVAGADMEQLETFLLAELGEG